MNSSPRLIVQFSSLRLASLAALGFSFILPYRGPPALLFAAQRFVPSLCSFVCCLFLSRHSLFWLFLSPRSSVSLPIFPLLFWWLFVYLGQKRNGNMGTKTLSTQETIHRSSLWTLRYINNPKRRPTDGFLECLCVPLPSFLFRPFSLSTLCQNIKAGE